MWSSPCRRDGEVEKSALRAVTSSLFGQERGLVRDVEPSLMVKKDGMILEIERTFKVLQHLMFRILLGKISMFRRNAPIDTLRIIQDRDTPISLRVIEVIISCSSFSRRSAKL